MAWVLLTEDSRAGCVMCVPERIAGRMHDLRREYESWRCTPGYSAYLDEMCNPSNALRWDEYAVFARWLTEHVLEPGERAYVVPRLDFSDATRYVRDDTDMRAGLRLSVYDHGEV